MRGLSAVERRGSGSACISPRRGRGIAAHRVDLGPEAEERIAVRVAQLLTEREDEGAEEMLSAGELALKLRVERPWVYRNRRLLGGTRLGNGPKARWRFEYGEAVRRLRALGDGEPVGGGSA